MTQRFNNAIDALVYAFFNDTLAKGDCKFCAVGNICAAAYGVKPDLSAKWQKPIIGEYKDNPFHYDDWSDIVWQDIFSAPSERERAEVMIGATGYSANELWLIEEAFEDNTKILIQMYSSKAKSEIMQDQYNGLMAVVDVLCEIEGIEDPTEYKQLFQFDAI